MFYHGALTSGLTTGTEVLRRVEGCSNIQSCTIRLDYLGFIPIDVRVRHIASSLVLCHWPTLLAEIVDRRSG